jgi:ketosteroid isomerase-like protein
MTVEAPAGQERKKNIAIVRDLLDKLGTRRFEDACALLSDDVRCEWPYPPARGLKQLIIGREPVLQFFRQGMSAFDPYAYQITEIHELVDPARLIAEYNSNTRLLATGQPYRNQYLGIFQFRGDQICLWREYINPMLVEEVLAGLSAEERARLPAG